LEAEVEVKAEKLEARWYCVAAVEVRG